MEIAIENEESVYKMKLNIYRLYYFFYTSLLFVRLSYINKKRTYEEMYAKELTKMPLKSFVKKENKYLVLI